MKRYPMYGGPAGVRMTMAHTNLVGFVEATLIYLTQASKTAVWRLVSSRVPVAGTFLAACGAELVINVWLLREVFNEVFFEVFREMFREVFCEVFCEEMATGLR
jgi:hypothetical protein